MEKRKQKYGLKLLSSCLFLLLFQPCFSQYAFDYSIASKAIGFHTTYGFILPHKVDFDALISGHVPGFEINYRYNYSGVKEWEKFYRLPNAGITMQYLNFNNAKIGSAVGLAPYISFNLIKKKKISFQWRIATGLGYVTKKFNLEDNRKNLVISTHFNSYVNMLWQLHFNINRRIEMQTGLAMTHFSNAAFKIPNAGINIISATAGFSFDIGKLVAVNNYTFPIVDKKWKYLVWTGGFVKETNPVEGKKYYAQTFSFNALRRISYKSSIGGGMDLMLDNSLPQRNKFNLNPETSPFRAGFNFSYALHFGKFSIPLQQGIYFIDNFKGDGMFYSRVGWRYHVNKKLIINLTLKTHFASADYLEAGFGYFIK
ncbi:MAG: acyloxyacyl hydrolase [Bacteroidota bacterium]|jgi:hypothetical protein